MNCTRCFYVVSQRISNAFGCYGRLVAKHAICFVLVPMIICCGLAVGFLFRTSERNIEVLYTPMNSRSRSDREKVKAIFPDRTGDYYNPMGMNDHPLGGIALFRAKTGANILTRESLQEIKNFIQEVKVLSNNDTDDDVITYDDVCGRMEGECEIWGSVILTDEFWEAFEAGILSYPFWSSPWGVVDLSVWLGNVNRTEEDIVASAVAVKVTFTLRQDSPENKFRSLLWEDCYIEFMKQLDEDSFNTTAFAFSSSQSMGKELDKGTNGDIGYFSLTFSLMITYASIVSAGGDCVSTRALLANSGVVAAAMGIFGSFGLVSLLGVQFVNIVGVVPFLVLGIGVDDMFLLMSSWSSTLGSPDLDVQSRIGETFRSAGIGITITSVTDFLAFAMGSYSPFLSVRNFCIYAGVAVLFCYICNATFFGGCLTLHGRRVYAGRHTITCKKIRARKTLSEEGEKCCKICMCGGTTPQNEFDDESPFEKAPRLLLPKLVLWWPSKIIIIVLFGLYLAASIWGMLFRLEQGLRLKDLVLESSYYYKFNTWDETDFGVAFPVAFVITEPIDYTRQETMVSVMELMSLAREDPDISQVGTYCWFVDYLFSPYMNLSSQSEFARTLRQEFLPRSRRYITDVVFDSKNESVIASRCHVFSKNVVESTRQAQLMTRMRELADSATHLPTFAYQPAFVFFEQYVTIMSSTLQTVGVTLAVMFVVTLMFLVHPTIVFLVFLNIVMIVVGIFGFMGIWGLTLSSVTMIHLIMSVGFSVDFCAHVCSAYMLSGGRTRHERAHYALVHASGPVLNSGLSSLIGIVVLVFSNSYIFQSFFKIMLLVILFGFIHAVFLVPVLLSLIGPIERDVTLSAGSCKGVEKGRGIETIAYKKRDREGHVKEKADVDVLTLSGYDTLGHFVGQDNSAFSNPLS